MLGFRRNSPGKFDTPSNSYILVLADMSDSACFAAMAKRHGVIILGPRPDAIVRAL
jgi:hypothetical protein